MFSAGSLLTRGMSLRMATTGEEGLELARAQTLHAAIVDVMMPGIGGMATLDELRKLDGELPVIMLTAHGSVDSAKQAIRAGAFDYITKPFKNDEVLKVLRNAVERRRLALENRTLRQSLQARTHNFADIIGRSPSMRQVFDLIMQAAPSRTTILIEGESGTGKELVARALHTHSGPRGPPVHHGQLWQLAARPSRIEPVRARQGAFTGALYPKKGLFELADTGSIFFDEIGNMPFETQAKLLGVMQERRFMRLGGIETIKVDVRLIAATNVDLKRMVDDGKFREDLYYRLHRDHGGAAVTQRAQGRHSVAGAAFPE